MMKTFSERRMKNGISKVGFAAIAAVIVFSISATSKAQAPDANAEALVNCPGLLLPEPLTPYGFAKTTLVSLWYARNADQHSAEITQAKNESNNSFALMTATMRATKMSTNDFICAKRSVKSFAVKASGENIQATADFLVDVYDAT
jgi:hypothetical protein